MRPKFPQPKFEQFIMRMFSSREEREAARVTHYDGYWSDIDISDMSADQVENVHISVIRWEKESSLFSSRSRESSGDSLVDATSPVGLTSASSEGISPTVITPIVPEVAPGTMTSIESEVRKRLLTCFPPYSHELFAVAVARLGRPISEDACEMAARRIKTRHEVLMDPGKVFRELSRMPPIGINRFPDALVFDDSDAIIAEYLSVHAQKRA